MKTFFPIFATIFIFYLVYFFAVYPLTRVPYVKTKKKILALIFTELKITPSDVIYDLGCGTGTFLLAAEKFQPKKSVGFELSPLHFLLAKINVWLKKSRAEIIYQNFFQADFSQADIIYIFLTIPTKKLGEKITKEAKPGCRIISLGGAVPYLKLDKTIDCQKTNLYFYTIRH